MPALNLMPRWGSNRLFGYACSLLLAVAIAGCGGASAQASTNLPPPPATQSTCATPAASNPVGGGGIYTQIAIDPRVYGKRDPAELTVFGFSQQDQSLPADPQVLAMSPNIVARAWARWDRGGVQPADYNWSYPTQARAAGIVFIGGTTATALFRNEFPAASAFNAVVSCDATGQPVFHSAMKFYRGNLASPAYRQYIIGIGKIQIDGGVDGLFFDEVDFSYDGAPNGNEGFDDASIADFGGFLCGKYPNYRPADWQSKYGITAVDNLDCAESAAARGRTFNYRGYLARNGWQESPLNRSNPLAAEWGTMAEGHPEPQNGTFTGTYTSLVYWQDIADATYLCAAKVQQGDLHHCQRRVSIRRFPDDWSLGWQSRWAGQIFSELLSAYGGRSSGWDAVVAGGIYGDEATIPEDRRTRGPGGCVHRLAD